MAYGTMCFSKTSLFAYIRRSQVKIMESMAVRMQQVVRDCAGGQYTSAGRWQSLSLDSQHSFFSLMSFVSIFPLATGVRWRYGYGFGD